VPQHCDLLDWQSRPLPARDYEEKHGET